MDFRVVSGFQSGTDLAAIRAAHSLGIPTGGWMPLGYLTLRPGTRDSNDTESHPEYRDLYGASEHPSPFWSARTFANARDSDLTLWHGVGDSTGYRCTLKACQNLNRPLLRSYWQPPSCHTSGVMADAIASRRPSVINLAGPRETDPPSIGGPAEAYFRELFRILLGL